MTYNPVIHHRSSIRLPGYEYSRQGSYFITVCTQDRKCLFGRIVNPNMVLNKYGEIANDVWLEIPVHFPHVQLDEFVVMPNHIHGIIAIVDAVGARPNTVGARPNTVGARPNTVGARPNTVGARHAVPQQREEFGKPVSGSIPTIVRAFKSAVTKRINEIRGTPGTKLWQRNYWERIIRNEKELYRIRKYIRYNPAKWQSDRLYLYGHGMPCPNEKKPCPNRKDHE